MSDHVMMNAYWGDSVLLQALYKGQRDVYLPLYESMCMYDAEKDEGSTSYFRQNL
jgi:hypothetical protein